LSVAGDLLDTVVEGTYLKERREELASFLRSRREGVRPQDVGLAPGARRRTPGLRREEVAQLAGVGVTWYTWLEQGRPINASVQVLDAIARVLKLGPAERWHLYRLADVPGVPKAHDADTLPGVVLPVLDALEPNPACVYNGKYDLLACNESYAALFPPIAVAAGIERNALWQIFAMGNCPVQTDGLLPHMVAIARANYARHVGEPQWRDFVERLSAESDDFAAMWASHQVAAPMPQVKSFDGDALGVVNVRTSSFAVIGMLESRMVVYLPASPADAAKIERLRTRAAASRVSAAS
jgi:transcriptional regulator with XRE-family HTH domain